MAERKVRITHQGKEVDGLEVGVSESSEKWSEFKLDDGTVIRMRLSLIQAVRVPGEYDDNGLPTYAMSVSPQMAVVDADPALRKKG